MTSRLPLLGLLGLLLSIGTASGQTPVSVRPALSVFATSAPADPLPPKRIQVHFSPNGGVTNAVVEAIREAKKRIRIQAYSFTSQPIAKAIVEAKRRGVQVTAILDKSNRTAKYSAATFLKNQGAIVRIDDAHAIAHDKIILIDDNVVITGSFNFTAAAEASNAENLLVIVGLTDLFSRYDENFAEHLKHSRPYEEPESGFGVSSQPALADPSTLGESVGAPEPATIPPPAATETGKVVGHTATGLPIYEGPAGGRYHYSKSGKKVYEKKK